MRADIAATPAWGGALPPEDDFLLMFLRAEVFSPSKAADRYRKFWEVWVVFWQHDPSRALGGGEDGGEGRSDSKIIACVEVYIS